MSTEYEAAVEIREAVSDLEKTLAGTHVDLRDRFALAALTGLLGGDVNDSHSTESAARTAYHIADAMLSARKVTTP